MVGELVLIPKKERGREGESGHARKEKMLCFGGVPFAYTCCSNHTNLFT
jgi:hypothetical protein